MSESPFPPDFPLVGDLVRITPVKEDYAPKNYKFFCEEAHVVSRFFGISYSGKEYCPSIMLGGHYIREVTFNQKYGTWSTSFDGQTVQVEVEKILE